MNILLILLLMPIFALPRPGANRLPILTINILISAAVLKIRKVIGDIILLFQSWLGAGKARLIMANAIFDLFHEWPQIHWESVIVLWRLELTNLSYRNAPLRPVASHWPPSQSTAPLQGCGTETRTQAWHGPKACYGLWLRSDVHIILNT